VDLGLLPKELRSHESTRDGLTILERSRATVIEGPSSDGSRVAASLITHD
jgi:hypothetical protein